MTASSLSSDVAIPPRFADAAGIVARSLRSFLPPPQIDTANYARNRWLENPGGGFTGKWDPDNAPYLNGPMKALDAHRYTTVAVPGPGQCGKTTIAENWLLRNVAIDPVNMLWYMQTDRVMRDYVKGEFDRIIRAHPILREKLGPKPSDDTQEFKRFGSMVVNFLVAAPNNLISRRAARLVVDEQDAYDPSLGNVIAQLDIRRQTFKSDSMLLALSHPDLARGLRADGWSAGIMQLYRRSTRGTWWWPCPHCGGYSSPNPTASRVMTLHYPEDAPLEEIAEAARLLCPICGSLIEDHHRRAMNVEAERNHGGWIHRGQVIDEDGHLTGAETPNTTAGFWIVGVMSTFTMGGLGGLASALVEAQRGYQQDRSEEKERDLRQIYTKRLGFPSIKPRQIGALDAAALVDRAEEHLVLGEVPEGVRFLTAWSDVQGSGFRILVRGWGVEAESWVIASINRPAEPTSSAEDWDSLIEWALTTGFPLSDGSGRVMKIRGFGYDAYGLPGVTQQAYNAFVRMAARRRIRNLGMQSGRMVWNVIPTKGMPGINAQRLAVVRPDTQRKDRMVRVSSGTLNVLQFGANAFKDDLAGQLGIMEPGPLAVHIPAALKSKDEPHVWFEELVAEQRQANGTWKKVVDSARNEALDQMVGNHAIAHLHGLRTLKWDRPPGWAAPWDRNPMVVMPTAETQVATTPATQPSPTPATPAAPSATVTVMPKARLFVNFAARMRH